MNKNKGFTLLELLIVIAIIAVLATVVVLILNPVEILRKSRDAQRVSDLNTLKSALGLYLTEVSSPSLGTCGANDIYTSIDNGTSMHTFGSWTWRQVSSANLANIDGTGWIPVSFEAISSGSPISNLPVDPLNQESATVATDRWFYTYVCNNTTKRFEMTARLESTDFSGKMSKDGGKFSDVYEVGTKLNLITTAHPYQ